MATPPILPDPNNKALTKQLDGINHKQEKVSHPIIVERPLTLFLNSQEIVTLMTICDHPKWLAVGYLLNQNMLKDDDEITAIDYEADIETIVVRTNRQTNYEEKLKKKVKTSGCGQGTVFGDLMEDMEQIALDQSACIKTSWLYQLTRAIPQIKSLYLKAGAIHGCVLCQKGDILLYMEDVGRHNAIDKLAGYMYLNKISPEDKMIYTTGRLTSEMVIKTVKMKVPILISRSGFTAWGVDLARKTGLTIIGRARGKRFMSFSGADRIIFDDA